MSALRIVLACVVVSASAPAIVHAQLVRGDLVRVRLGSQRIAEGTYLGNDSLRYALIASGSDTSRIPLDGGFSAERRVPGKPGGADAAVEGTGIGFGIGMGLLGLARLGANGHEDGAAYAAAFVAGMFTTATGLVIGTVVAFTQHHHWEKVSLQDSPHEQ